MIVESLIKRATSGVLTTDSGGNASCTINANGELLAVEVVLGTSSSATVSMTNDQAVSLFSKSGVNSSQQFVPAKTMTDGTTPRSTPVVLYGNNTLTIASGGDTKTVTVNLYYR
jgi:hypothetical protein